MLITIFPEMRLFYFNPLPGLPVAKQIEMAREYGFTDRSSAWTDTAKSFPKERARLLRALRPGQRDDVWVAVLPCLGAGRADLRHVANELEKCEAGIIEGHSGWKEAAPHGGRMWANAWEVYSQSRKLLDDPRGSGKAARQGARNRRMPNVEARAIWLDPALPTNEEAIAKMNADPRYRREWTWRTAYKHFGKSGRPPGTRRRSLQPLPPE